MRRTRFARRRSPCRQGQPQLVRRRHQRGRHAAAPAQVPKRCRLRAAQRPTASLLRATVARVQRQQQLQSLVTLRRHPASQGRLHWQVRGGWRRLRASRRRWTSRSAGRPHWSASWRAITRTLRLCMQPQALLLPACQRLRSADICQGAHLLRRAPVSLAQAALGGAQ